jgi:hypothetical protein
VKDSDDVMMRYLVGELSEPERVALESRYFADQRAFDRLERFEQDLIDKYARGRLPGETRARFEAAYLSNPNRRERLKFGEALAARIDQSEPSPVMPVNSGYWRQRLLSWVGPESRALAFSMALVLLLLAAGSVWLLVQSSRLRAELARRDSAAADQAQRQAELQRQLGDQQKQNQELAAQLERLSNTAAPQTSPSPGGAVPAFVTLFLAANGVRGAEPAAPATLIIPKGTQEVRVNLTLKDHDYRDYQIVLQAIAGPEIFNRRNLKPRINRSGATFSLSLPASKLPTGDYMLTLRGAAPGGEFEDVSNSLFHVEYRAA